jgi:hypothetical protein
MILHKELIFWGLNKDIGRFVDASFPITFMKGGRMLQDKSTYEIWSREIAGGATARL